MPKKRIYFQWQNEALLGTIYPLRNLNLRNALEYFEEIDLWKKYGGKKIEDLPNEVAEYHRKKAVVIEQARRDYETHLDHFFDYDPEQDPEFLSEVEDAMSMLRKAKKPQNDFKAYYDHRVEPGDQRRKITDPFKKSYFISQQLETLDRDRRDLDQRILSQSRRVKAIEQNNPHHDKLQGERDKLEALRKLTLLFEKQRGKLMALISAFGRIESRRKDFLDRRKQAERDRRKIDTELPKLKSDIAAQESKVTGLQDEVRRLRSQLEPASDDNYFADPDALTEAAHRFPLADPAFCERVDAIREALAALKSRATIRERVQKELTALQAERTRYRQRSRSKSKEHTLKAYNEVLEKLEEYGSFLEKEKKTIGAVDKVLKDKETELGKLQDVWRGLVEKLSSFLNKIEVIDFLQRMDVEEYVTRYQPVPPTMKDIVSLKLDEYRESLMAGDKSKDPFQYQFFLLDLLIKRFKREPKRFPRWLQYMIVHFSGMRYASAHGSWGDAKDLYLTLQTSLLSDKLLDDHTVEMICRQKIADYAGETVLESTPEGSPRPSRTKDAKFREKLDGHLARLNSDDAHERRQGLLNLLLDEENYDIETMTDQEALDALEDLRQKGLIPDWMWEEIVAMTDLRLKEVRDKDWETLDEAQRREKSEPRWAKNRDLMNQWKEKHLTGWRKEHEGNIQNLVSRAVCNEVAEHILHLRGHEGPAGLSEAGNWYVEAGQKSKGSLEQVRAGQEAPYFVKPKGAQDYRPGAAILWLKYRNGEVPQWNKVNPFKTVEGDGTLPEAYISGKRWVYKDKAGLFRIRTVVNEKGMPVPIRQYLFWVHIATVAEVADTAEGKVVLTFETSLPYEDRRLACVGLFKRALHNLLFDGGEDAYNASFVGYMPDGPRIPNKDLNAMLDWDKVLLKA